MMGLARCHRPGRSGPGCSPGRPWAARRWQACWPPARTLSPVPAPAPSPLAPPGLLHHCLSLSCAACFACFVMSSILHPPWVTVMFLRLVGASAENLAPGMLPELVRSGRRFGGVGEVCHTSAGPVAAGASGHGDGCRRPCFLPPFLLGSLVAIRQRKCFCLRGGIVGCLSLAL